MATTRRFYDLDCRVRELRRHLLPKKFSPIGYYSERVYDLVRGFQLLAHAEIESFLEESSKQTATSKISEWANQSKPNLTTICLISCHFSDWEERLGSPPSPVSIKELEATASEISKKALNAHIHTLNNNNGIKEDNLKRILIPIGINIKGLDPVWITNMENFGSDRGNTAHSAKRTSQPPDPKTEWDKVLRLLIGLKDVDQKIKSL